MPENHRATFRVDTDLDAELFHEGRVVACHVRNLSAGGALIETGIELRPGTQCTLGMRLGPKLAKSAGVEYVSFHTEVLATTELLNGEYEYRMRNLTATGSAEYEQAHRIVFEEQRRALAEQRGNEDQSPMASDHERRERLRPRIRTRFGKGSIRPGHED